MQGSGAPEPTEDFVADPVELFFDLAFVFAFSQMVGLLVGSPTWGAVGQATLISAQAHREPRQEKPTEVP